MSIRGELDRLTTGLSARERALLLLAVLKDRSKPEDPLWRSTMPRDQLHEFNRYIDLMNAANMQVAALVMHVRQEVEKLDLYLMCLTTLRYWEINLAQIDFAVTQLIKEPVTVSEHELLAAQAAAAYLPVADAAHRLVGLERAWSDEDLEQVALVEELLVKDDAWARLQAEAEQRLRAAVAAGEIEAKGKGSALKVRAGSFDAWLGRPPTPVPESGASYEVRPDSESAAVARDRHTLANLRRVLSETPAQKLGPQPPLEGLIELLEQKTRALWELRWKDLRCAERLLEMIAAEFGGVDPLKPVTRADLDGARELLESLVGYFHAFGPEPERREPTEEDLGEMRALVERGQTLFRLPWDGQ